MSRKLLLHACCAPCLAPSMQVLTEEISWKRVLPEKPDFDISVFFYNPNIHPEKEYRQRLDEVRTLSKKTTGFEVIEGPYEIKEWFDMAREYRHEPERGKRCLLCYKMRLEKTFQEARRSEFEIIATTLTLSPLKDATVINRIGKELSEKYGIAYLETNFKKQNGVKRSSELSKKYGLYRQDYCGCVYSRLERERQKKGI